MTSKTAITRGKPSSPTYWLYENGYLAPHGLDYGCGKGFDAEYLGWDRYDPFYAPIRPTILYYQIICQYVLNVVSEYWQRKILKDIRSILGLMGQAFITVRRDLPREGRPGRDCFQRYVELNLPILHKTSWYCIYLLEK